MVDTENKTDRKSIHNKVEIFDTYVNVLMFMIENKGKSFMKKDVKQSIFGDDKTDSIKVMISRVVDFYISSNIFVKVTEVTDEDGITTELKPNQTQFRLYDENIDEEFEEDKVNLHIPKSREGRLKLCETVSSMIMNIPDAVIYTETIKTVLESQLFGFNTDFVSNTIGKVILKHHNYDNNGNYPLDVLVSIIESKVDVNVKIENFGNVIQLNNTKIKRITIKENGFDVHFDNFISQNQSDIKQLISIENSSEDGLREDIEKVKSMINDLPIEKREEVIGLFDSVTPLIDIFEF